MQTSQPDAGFFRRTVLLLAAYGEVDKRTADRAAREGIDAIHGFVIRCRLRRAAEQLGVELPIPSAPVRRAEPPRLTLITPRGER